MDKADNICSKISQCLWSLLEFLFSEEGNVLSYSLNQWKTSTQSQNTISTDILMDGVLQSSQQETGG